MAQLTELSCCGTGPCHSCASSLKKAFTKLPPKGKPSRGCKSGLCLLLTVSSLKALCECVCSTICLRHPAMCSTSWPDNRLCFLISCLLSFLLSLSWAAMLLHLCSKSYRHTIPGLDECKYDSQVRLRCLRDGKFSLAALLMAQQHRQGLVSCGRSKTSMDSMNIRLPKIAVHHHALMSCLTQGASVSSGTDLQSAHR